ncbi:MAG: hypothetical protein ACUVR2_10400 [Anaerolineae bacterium]
MALSRCNQAHVRVLQALGFAEAADEQARLSEAIIAAKASRIPEPEQRRRYLEAKMYAP